MQKIGIKDDRKSIFRFPLALFVTPVFQAIWPAVANFIDALYTTRLLFLLSVSYYFSIPLPTEVVHRAPYRAKKTEGKWERLYK